ncbi:hypothetical protein AB0M72_23595 [Nocardiopsis dassonvillei]|uniref:hypothetical protein n=1 Tax=Nocardiopsis dassonvillei TaxID=2014 RepID=UPI00200E5F44|nr:hypothetical protein [Nocardiopsis dassonvillei]MCK9871486.1 hypothetical protein [Nocardiopsis dassonvillei]
MPEARAVKNRCHLWPRTKNSRDRQVKRLLALNVGVASAYLVPAARPQDAQVVATKSFDCLNPKRKSKGNCKFQRGMLGRVHDIREGC